MRTAVHVNLPPDMSPSFEDDHDPLLIGKLKNLSGVWSPHQTRATRWKTITFRIVFRIVHRVVVVDGRRPWLERNPRLFCSASCFRSGQSRIRRLGSPYSHLREVQDSGQPPDALLRSNPAQIGRSIG